MAANAFPDVMAGAAVSLARLDPFAPEPSPTANDVREAGPRGGAARVRFFRRRAAFRAFVGLALDVRPDDVMLGYDSGGAPRLLAPSRGFFVSVSARGSWAVFALAGQPVGIDLELVDPLIEPAWFALAPAEHDRLANASGPARAEDFLHIWTAKEAYLKARGTGLMRDPAEIEIVWRAPLGFAVRDGGDQVAGQGEWTLSERSGERLIVAAWRDGPRASSSNGPGGSGRDPPTDGPPRS